MDIDKIFNDWSYKTKSISQSPINQIQDIDPTLKGLAGKLVRGFENDIGKLKGRVISYFPWSSYIPYCRK